MARMSFVGSVALALALLAGHAQSQPNPPGTWTQKKPLPVARNEVALAAVGDKLYVVGGSIGGNAVPMLDRYDPATDTWVSLAPLPKGLDHLGIAVLNGKIVTVGGFIGSPHRGAVADVYEYDPAANSWRTLAPLNAPRGKMKD